MATIELEDRVTALEENFAKMMQERKETEALETPWWKKIVGAFEGDPEFLEAMRLGREWRDSEAAGEDEQEDAA